MAEDKEEKDEKQKPEKPKKTSGGVGDMNFKRLIIIIGGVVVLQVVILVIVFKVFLAPAEPAADAKNGAKETTGESKVSEEMAAEDESKIKYTSLKFENITTKDFQWYILLQLGFKVIHLPKEGEEEEAGGHGAGKDDGYQLPPELISILKSFIIGYFGDMTIEDVQAKRPGLIDDLTQKLKPIFKTNRFLLKNIALEQFTPVKVN